MSIFLDLITPLAKAGVHWLSGRSKAQVQGELRLEGLSAPVEVIRDRWGVPHIYAQNQPDLFFAQGFVHAQERLFQMELNRRTARGTLSEVFGALALETDRAVRTFGFARLGQADWDQAGEHIHQTVEAYTAGVNAFIKSGARMPAEFALLGLSPYPWEPLDSLAFSRLMIWQLSHGWYHELVRAKVAEAVGEEQAAKIAPRYPGSNPSTLPAGIEFNRIDPDGRLLQAQGPFLSQGNGSNSWVVAGSRSDTGKPYLCNDMHLALRVPSLWYLAHLVGGGLNVTGASLPGLPMVLVGHNDRIAWGMTLAFTDCEDLFIEQVDPENPRRYQFKGEWREMEVLREEIPVKRQPEDHVERVRITHHGPIVSEVIGHPQQHLAVSSMALRPVPALDGWYRLNAAQGWDDFVEAMRRVEAPQLNVTYADVDGNIGYWVTGKVPLRLKGDGSLPAPGWTGEWEWAGEVPFEEMPHALNPARGLLVSCNNRIVPDDYPYNLGQAWMNGYRARRIEDVLDARPTLSPEDFKQEQMDFTCLPGLELANILGNVTDSHPDVQLALSRLRGWDGNLTSESVPGALYEVIRYSLVRNLFEPCLGHDLTNQVLGKGWHPLLYGSHEFYGHDTTTLLRTLLEEKSWWVEKAGGREQLIIGSIRQAVDWLRQKLGADPDNWQWGKLHQLTFGHSLSLQKPLDRIFDRGPYPVGGDTDTPNQTAVEPGNPYNTFLFGATFRQIVDMGDLSKSQVLIPPGQSGNVASPHYDDLIQPWLKGEYIPMLWTRAQVEAEAEGKLELKSFNHGEH